MKKICEICRKNELRTTLEIEDGVCDSCYEAEKDNCTVCGACNTEKEIEANGGVCYNCHTPFYK